MIPAPALALAKRLPWKWILGIGAILLGLGAIVWGAKAAIDNARTSGLKQGRSEVMAKWEAEKAGRQQARAELTAALAEAFNGLDGSLQRTLTKVSADGQTIRIKLDKEMANDPRYASADCSITPGVLDQINAARGLSGPAAASPVRDGGVPAAGAAVRLDLGDAGGR